MVQQMAIYEQGCKLMVSAHPFRVQTNRITFLNRMQVRVLSALGDIYLTQGAYS